MKNISSKNNFNQKAKEGMPKPKAEKSYSHHDVKKKLDNYSAVAKKPTDKAKMNQLKNNYLEAKKKTDFNAGGNKYTFEKAKEVGLHSTKSVKDFERSNAQVEQAKRNKTVKEAKEYYHQNYSLTKKSKTAYKGKENKKKDVKMDKG